MRLTYLLTFVTILLLISILGCSSSDGQEETQRATEKNFDPSSIARKRLDRATEEINSALEESANQDIEAESEEREANLVSLSRAIQSVHDVYLRAYLKGFYDEIEKVWQVRLHDSNQRRNMQYVVRVADPVSKRYNTIVNRQNGTREQREQAADTVFFAFDLAIQRASQLFVEGRREDRQTFQHQVNQLRTMKKDLPSV